MIVVGCRVIAQGLVGRADLNDQEGLVISYSPEKGRFGVRFGEADEASGNVKPINLRLPEDESDYNSRPESNPRDECGICLTELPAMGQQCFYQACCGKMVCIACKHSMSTQGAEQRKSVPCAFCRAPPEADLHERMQRLESRAAKNDSRAHFELAGYYFLGRASRVDVDMGVTHVNAALDLGCAQAQFHYGMFYQNGCWAGTHVPGVRIDLARAADLYTLAAEQGHDHAGMNLQLMLLGGGPGSAAWDPGRAMGMLHRLAEEHHSTYAHHRLGCIYHGLWPPSGPVVEKSAKQAISHYRVTAEMPTESLLNCPACKAKPLGMLCPFDCTSKLGQVSESSYNLACLAAVAGAQDEALEWLAKAVATGFNKSDVAMRDDELASVAFLPAFDALLKKMRGKKRTGPKSRATTSRASGADQ